MYNEKYIKSFGDDAMEAKSDPHFQSLLKGMHALRDNNEKYLTEMAILLSKIDHLPTLDPAGAVNAPRKEGFIGEVESVLSDLHTQSNYLGSINSFLRKLVG